MILPEGSVRRVMDERKCGMNEARSLITRSVIMDELNDVEDTKIKGIIFTILHELGWDTSSYEAD